MKLSMKQLGGILGAAALTVGGLGLLGSSGCEEVTDACGLTCDEKVAEGNFSITGVKSVDAFFKSAVDFKGTADQISAGIKAEIDGLKADLEITDADLQGGATLGTAIKAKFEAEFDAELVVDAQPAKCEVDARAQLQASVDCQAEAKCEVEVDPGSAMIECKGSCEVDASAEVSCGANVNASCTFKGPNVACEGQCKGSCTLEAEAALDCSGTCSGTCDGTCNGETGNGVACEGTCEGECQGTCKVESSAGVECSGSCSGECVVTGAEINCEGAVEAKCEGSAEASVMCSGSCKGDFEPPSAMAECEASASCNAQAKADASLKVECTPPSIDVRVKVAAALDAEAQGKLDFKVAALKARLPKILASLEKGKLVVEAGADLVDTAGGAVEGALDAFAGADVSAVAKYKLLTCAPDQFAAVGTLLQSSTAELKAQVTAAGEISAGLGG